MVINLPRHLEQVEKIVRVSDERKDIMAITDVPTPNKIDGTDFGIFADHPQKGLLLEYTEYRKAVQQRASSTVSKDMKSLMECLKALNRSGNLQLILKAPDENRNRIRHIFRARIQFGCESNEKLGQERREKSSIWLLKSRDYHSKSGFSSQAVNAPLTAAAQQCNNLLKGLPFQFRVFNRLSRRLYRRHLLCNNSAQGTTIPNPGFQQAVKAPLPPSPTLKANLLWRYHFKSGFSTGCQYTPTTILTSEEIKALPST
ncbi:hypothetical protein RRG08_011461 [Elysia crispata]|uniref:Uncharacterized protein n=1 Tax=Elysia crispata TaxID=231223 RepID=A0AAE0YTN0_9GAST|nr:hypothetical protein RRG08_011461 [Elysia crispata]